jgi:hypothetical protein
VKKNYQGTGEKSKRKFEVLGNRELLVQVPLPMVEVWEEMQAQVERMTGEAGLRIIGAILENEVKWRVGARVFAKIDYWRKDGMRANGRETKGIKTDVPDQKVPSVTQVPGQRSFARRL